MIGHNDEVMQSEFPRCYKRSKHINKELRISFSLQQQTSHTGFGCCEEDAPVT